MPSNDDHANTTASSRASSPRRRIASELRERPMAYAVLAVFLVIGPLAAPFLFPEAPPAAGIIGGLAFGIYAALCAVPQKFL